MTMKFMSERVGEGAAAVSLAKRLLLGGTATLALVAAISAAPVNFERSLLGDFSGANAHAQEGEGGGEGGGEGDGGGSEGGGDNDSDHDSDSDSDHGSESGSDDSGENGSDDSGENGSDDSGENGSDDSSEGGDDSATAGDDDGTPDQGTGDVPAGSAPVIVPTP